ncbi:hypothetical protein M0802_015091 [Mischocyttarus mexicanus]|nr:hypothetical protein M0802_015091 [Mischocyttarus mexicanus]
MVEWFIGPFPQSKPMNASAAVTMKKSKAVVTCRPFNHSAYAEKAVLGDKDNQFIGTHDFSSPKRQALDSFSTLEEFVGFLQNRAQCLKAKAVNDNRVN